LNAEVGPYSSSSPVSSSICKHRELVCHWRGSHGGRH
jgi:hypothetical protein